MNYKTIIYKKEGKIVTITLNRPERLNAESLEMWRELGQAWREFNNDDDAWVAIVTGAGRTFSVGGDVKDILSGELPLTRFAEADIPPQDIEGGPRAHKVRKPVIAAINGACCGDGLDYATESDIVIASEKAEFWDPHVAVGMVSNHEAVRLSRRIPVGLALRMTIMGNADRMSAERAYQIGLVSEVVPPERLMDRAREIAQAIVEQSAPLAVRNTKQCILDGLNMPIDAAIEHGEYLRRENVGTEDQIEGIRAFNEKRKPVWKNR